MCFGKFLIEHFADKKRRAMICFFIAPNSQFLTLNSQLLIVEIFKEFPQHYAARNRDIQRVFCAELRYLDC